MESRKQEQVRRARRSYRRVAKKILKSNSIHPNADSRLMNAIKKTARDYVHNTGQIRLQDVDGIGPQRGERLASIGIYSPDDLYDEYEKGNYEALLSLQVGDNAFTTREFAKTISASPALPEEYLGLKTIGIELPDGSIKSVKERRMFDIFRKELRDEDLSSEDRKLKNLLTLPQRKELMNKFKNSNSIDGIEKTLKDVKESLEIRQVELQPFAVKSNDEWKGSRIDEMKSYLDDFGIASNRDSIITLEERGAYLTKEIITAFNTLTPEQQERIVSVGLEEVAPMGKVQAIKKKILSLVKSDLRPEAKNAVSDLLNRSRALRSLESDEDRVSEIVMEMIDDGMLQTSSVVNRIPMGNLYPTDRAVKSEIMGSHSVKIGKTNNPRVSDYLGDDSFLFRYPNETNQQYMNRLMELGGKLVFENKGITRNRLNLKIPVRGGDNFDGDFNKAVEMLGFNIQNGFAPTGYEYKDPRFAERYNTFNVFVRPPSEMINKYYTPNAFAENEDAFLISINEPTNFIPNHDLTNILSLNREYVTSLCPPHESTTKIKEAEALARALAGAYDTKKPNRRGITDVVDYKDGMMTAMCKLGRVIKPDEFRSTDCYGWNYKTLASKIKNVLESDEFTTYEKRSHADALEKFADETLPILEKMEVSIAEADKMRQKTRNKIGKYYKRRRVGCTQVENMSIEPDNKTLVTIPKNSPAGRDLKEKIDDFCPPDETEDMENCLNEFKNQITLHQNITEGGHMESLIRNKNLKYIDPHTLNDGLKIIRNKVFRSPDDWIGGRKKQKFAFDRLEMGQYKTLDFGEWDFLED